LNITRADTHRHLGGAVTVDLMYALSQKHGLGWSYREILEAMTFTKGESRSFYGFLSKFDFLHQVPWDEEDLDNLVNSVVSGLLSEAIEYCELHFSVGKFLKTVGGSPTELIRRAKSLFDDAAEDYPLEIILVLAVKYEGSQSGLERETALSVKEYRDCVGAIDFVGDEAKFDVDTLRPICEAWSDCGKFIMAHAGESQSAENVRLAVEELGATRIAHGVRVPLEDPGLLEKCIGCDVCFDIAPTSNLVTGVVHDMRKHPARDMLDAGAMITIGTDDPVVCSTTLDREYEIARKYWGLTEGQIDQIKVNALKSAFRTVTS